jgi:hypothetical protein
MNENFDLQLKSASFSKACADKIQQSLPFNNYYLRFYSLFTIIYFSLFLVGEKFSLSLIESLLYNVSSMVLICLCIWRNFIGFRKLSTIESICSSSLFLAAVTLIEKLVPKTYFIHPYFALTLLYWQIIGVPLGEITAVCCAFVFLMNSKDTVLDAISKRMLMLGYFCLSVCVGSIYRRVILRLVMSILYICC